MKSVLLILAHVQCYVESCINCKFGFFLFFHCLFKLLLGNWISVLMNWYVCMFRLWFENVSGFLFWIALFFPCTALILLVYGIDIKVSELWDLLIPRLLYIWSDFSGDFESLAWLMWICCVIKEVKLRSKVEFEIVTIIRE